MTLRTKHQSNTPLKVKDFATSFLGIAISQGILFFAFYFIAKNLGAEILGTFSASLAIGTLIGTASALRYELSCLSNNQQESQMALVHSIAVSFALIVPSAGILAIVEPVYLDTLFFSFAFLVNQAVSLYLTSERSYATSAFMRIAANLTFLTAVVAFGQTYKNHLILLYALSLSAATGTIIIFCCNIQRASFRLGMRFYREQVAFPKYILPATALSSVLVHSMPMLFPLLHGAREAGFLAVAQRFGGFPIALIAQSIGSVLRRDTLLPNTPQSKLDLAVIYKKYLRILIFIAIAYATLGVILAGALIEYAFGSTWSASTTYFYCLIPLFATQIVYTTISQALLSTKNQKLDLRIQALIGASLTIGIAISWAITASPIYTIAVFSATGSCALIASTYIVTKKVLS